MKKNFLILLGVLFFGFAQAQVGINTTTPHASAALDVESTNKGVLLPRMTTAQKTAIVNPASSLMVYDTDLQCVSQNIGIPAAPAWVCLSGNATQSSFFYMPSIAIDASEITTTPKTLDLYGEYKTQFTTGVKNTAAPSSIPYYGVANSLHYYITRYDADILADISIDDNGVMTYSIQKESDYKSFITVVFVVK